MSLALPQSGDTWSGLHSGPTYLDTSVLPDAPAVTPSTFELSTAQLHLNAVLEVEGIPNYPEQAWTAVFTNQEAVFENHPTQSWPKVVIRFHSDQSLGSTEVLAFFSVLPDLEVTELSIKPSDNTVEGEVLYSRVLLSVDIAGRSSLAVPEAGQLFSLRHEPLMEEDRRDLISRAKLFRKLRYIEEAFNTKLLLPSDISADDVRLVEIVFDGITQGVSSVRGWDITVPGVLRSEVDVTKPPFAGPGEFQRVVSWDGKYVGLFQRKLEVGPVMLVLKRAEIADPRIVERLIEHPNQLADLRFVVYDHQIIHRFEGYAMISPKKRLRRLAIFKKRLAQEEPQEMAELTSEPLSKGVSEEAAIQIAHGWLYWNRLPDRYCPQNAEPIDGSGAWRVPIRLVYAGGSGGPVGELRIDKATGEVVAHTALEQMQSKGRALAETIFRG